MLEGDVGTPVPGVAGRGHAEAERGEPLVGEVDGVRRQRTRLVENGLDPGLRREGGPLQDGDHAEDCRRADLEALDAVYGFVVGAHVELVALAEPAPDRLPENG